jgi:HPt (histidine-containing phosphotransfer) domain-containing protein
MTDMPVDLANLRTITDGDRDTEVELFAQFCQSGDVILQELQKCCVDGHSDGWYRSSHSLKGTAYSLGAQVLGDLAKEAQNSPALPATDKTVLLAKIRDEYSRVTAFLSTVHP